MIDFKIELFDEDMKTYAYEVSADDYTEAVTQAMDKAFEEMPDNKFALLSVQGEGWIEEDEDDDR